MTGYQFYLLNDDDRDVARHNHLCTDDRSAIRMARSLCFENNVDIWSGGRRVGRVGQSEFATLGSLL